MHINMYPSHTCRYDAQAHAHIESHLADLKCGELRISMSITTCVCETKKSFKLASAHYDRV